MQPVKEKETKKMINWMSSVLECDGKLLVRVTLYRHVNMYMHSLSITKNKHINQDQDLLKDVNFPCSGTELLINYMCCKSFSRTGVINNLEPLI